MAARVCATPGCPTIVEAGARNGRCIACQRRNEHDRGTAAARGYDSRHRRQRADYQRRMNAGEVFICWRCAELGRPHPVDPDPDAWHLGHQPGDPSIVRGPQCTASNLDTSRG